MLQKRFVLTALLATVLLAGIFQTTAAFGKEYAITIDAGKTGEPISKFIYGQFIEHLGALPESPSEAEKSAIFRTS